MEFDLEELPTEKKKLGNDPSGVSTPSYLSDGLSYELWCLYVEGLSHKLLFRWIGLLHFRLLSVGSGCYVYLIMYIRQLLIAERERNQRGKYT